MVSITDDPDGRWVVDLPGVEVHGPFRTRGGSLALTREAAMALREARNQLPLPPATGG
jgi:hypothetical protein